MAATEYARLTGNVEVLRQSLGAARRQLEWFERERRAQPEGFYYSDIFNRRRESGVDEGVRFDNAPRERLACVDATSHVYLLCAHASQWADRLGEDSRPLHRRVETIRDFIQ